MSISHRRFTMGKATAFAAGVAFAILSGCGTARNDRDAEKLRVRVDFLPALRSCTYTLSEGTGLNHLNLSVPVGKYAVEEIGEMVGRVFADDLIVDSSADIVLVPRIVEVQYQRVEQRGLGGRRGKVRYVVDVLAANDERIASIEGGGYATSGGNFITELGRFTVHLGTLTLLGDLDEMQLSRNVISTAAEAAADDLATRIKFDSTINSLRGVSAREKGGSVLGFDVAADKLLESVLPARMITVAMLDLEPLTGPRSSLEAYLAEELRTRLARHPRVRSVERGLLDDALRELRLNMSDLVDPSNARHFGRQIHADAILTGTVTNFDHLVKIQLRLLDTETGRVIGAAGELFTAKQGLPRAAGHGSGARGLSGAVCAGGIVQ